MQIHHDVVVSGSRLAGVLGGAMLMLALANPAQLHAQQVLTQASRTITLARGASALVQFPDVMTRISVGDEATVRATLLSAREVLIDGLQVGTSTVLVWDRAERVTMMSVIVTPDIGALQRQIATLFADVPVTLSASGSAIIVSGTVRDPHIARSIIEIVTASGAQVINNLLAPPARQVLLHVRFAEVNRTALNRINADLRLLNPQNLGTALENLQLLDFETLAEGAVRLFLLGDNGAGLETVLRALKTQGELRSLAEPNLITVEGQPATFLAGGEFPFPIVQGATGTVAIQWKEFGVRLNFLPHITNSGTIRLHVEPEVSSLDFANGLTFGGFQIPALLTRRTSTDIELRPGQVLAIAGLLDNSTLREWQKIPLLGDLPIIGTFFRSRSARERNTELLVLVTPHLVEPLDAPPPLPTGEPSTWDRERFLRDGRLILPSGVRILPPGGN